MSLMYKREMMLNMEPNSWLPSTLMGEIRMVSRLRSEESWNLTDRANTKLQLMESCASGAGLLCREAAHTYTRLGIDGVR
jgi:hypothetical protein